MYIIIIICSQQKYKIKIKRSYIGPAERQANLVVRVLVNHTIVARVGIPTAIVLFVFITWCICCTSTLTLERVHSAIVLLLGVPHLLLLPLQLIN